MLELDKVKVGLFGLITTLIGGWDLTLQVLLILMTVDVITGMIKGFKAGNFTSKALREGLWSKCGFIFVLIVCYQLDVLMCNDEPLVRTVGALFYIAVEGASILENIAQMGVPIPSFIVKNFGRLKELSDNNEINKIER